MSGKHGNPLSGRIRGTLGPQMVMAEPGFGAGHPGREYWYPD